MIDQIFTSRYKMVVAEALVEFLKPIQESIIQYLSNPEYLVDILEQGNQKAQTVANATWEEVQYKLGLRHPLKNQINVKMNKQY